MCAGYSKYYITLYKGLEQPLTLVSAGGAATNPQWTLSHNCGSSKWDVFFPSFIVFYWLVGLYEKAEFIYLLLC
jgi:hypothetical protein